jgi:polyribonucleotide nucleotidyltransferase
MLATLPNPKPALSVYAPKIETVKIPVDKIGELIGPGGKVIKNIIAQTGAQVDVEDDGTVTISGIDTDAVAKAVDWVKGLVREVEVGEAFEGEVKRILPFGAFVEFLPGKEGMVHVSKMSTEYVNNPSEVVEIGQKVKVRVAEIDDQGRVNLSMLFGEDAEAKEKERSERPRSDRPYSPRPYNAGGQRPYSPRPSGDRDFNRRGPSDRSAASVDHPLSQQFRRERRTTGFGNKPGYPKKTNYSKKPTY